MNAVKYDIRSIRKHLDLSQKEMAAELGIRQSFLSAIENGKSPLPKDKAEIIKGMVKPAKISDFLIETDKNDGKNTGRRGVATPLENSGETDMFKELLNYFHTQAHREQDEHHVNMHKQFDAMQERADRLVEKNDALVSKCELLSAKIESLREELHSAKSENLRLKELLLSNGIKF